MHLQLTLYIFKPKQSSNMTEQISWGAGVRTPQPRTRGPGIKREVLRPPVRHRQPTLHQQPSEKRDFMNDRYINFLTLIFSSLLYIISSSGFIITSFSSTFNFIYTIIYNKWKSCSYILNIKGNKVTLNTNIGQFGLLINITYLLLLTIDFYHCIDIVQA